MPAAGPEKALPGFFTDLISGLSILSTFSADRKISPGYGFTAAPECRNCISAPPHLPASPGCPMQKYNFCTPPETFRSTDSPVLLCVFAPGQPVSKEKNDGIFLHKQLFREIIRM
jgi:hypothetical protein